MKSTARVVCSAVSLDRVAHLPSLGSCTYVCAEPERRQRTSHQNRKGRLKQSNATYGIDARSFRHEGHPCHGAEGRHGGGAFKIGGPAIRATFIVRNHGEVARVSWGTGGGDVNRPEQAT